MTINQASSINWLDKVVDWGWQAFATVFIVAFGWIWNMERRFSNFKLQVSENYVKKPDLDTFKKDIAGEFKDIKDSQAQILDVLLGQKIGTHGKRR